MANIKITLSQDKCINREAEHMKKQGGLFYQLPKLHKEAKSGCWGYFILRDHLVARAKALKFEEFKEGQRKPLLDYEGKDI